MVKIQLATGYLEVKEGTSFPLNFQVGDIRDISQRKGNFSKTITLVGSKNNNDLLNHYYDVNIVAGSFDINAVTTCSVIQDGIPVMEDASLQLTSVKKVQLTDGYEEHVEYEVLIKESKADFFTAINNKELTDIDFSDLNHTYDAFNVVNRFTNTVVDGFKYFLPGSGDVFYITQEFKPAIFAKTYFDRIFSDSGFQYNWPTLSADKFDKLVIPYNGGIDNFDYLDYVVRAEKTTPSTVLSPLSQTPTTATYTFTGLTEIEDPQNIFDPVTGIYTTPFNISSANAQYYEIKILVNFSLDIINVGSNFSVGTPKFYLNFFNAPFNVNSASPFYSGPSTPGPGTTNITTDTLIVTIQATDPSLLPQLTALTSNVQAIFDTTGGYYLLGYNLSLTINSAEITITPSSNIAAVGGTIDVNDYVPKKIKQNEFVKGIFNMFNLYAVVDKTQPNQLNLIHRDDYYDAGQEVDWTYKLAKDREQSLSFLPELTSKKVILTYKADKDTPNQIYTDATNQIYGQAEVVFDNEYVKDVTTKDVLFSPTPIDDSTFGAFIPMLAGAQPDTNIRILYDSTAEVGLTTCQAFNIYDYGTTGMTNITSYPYVGHFDDPLNPTWDLNFATCAYYYYMPSTLTQNNLYNRYWRRTMGQINNGKMLTAYFNLKEPDIQALELNDKIRIDNSWWNINKVIDYNANANQLTQVELISIDTETQLMPFATGSPTPGVGTGSVGPITQVSNDTIVKTKTSNTNVIPGSTSGVVTGKGNIVSPGLKVVVVSDNAAVEEDGIYTDNLRVYGAINGIPVQASYYSYVALLNQTGVAIPTADVKQTSYGSTLGNIIWTRLGPGDYLGTLQKYDIGSILASEIFVTISSTIFDCLVSARFDATNNTIVINTNQIGVGFVDNYLDNTPIEIRYYKP
jgi:hypothetical protein